MSINLFKIYGIVVGVLSIVVGLALLFLKKIDLSLSDNGTTEKEIKSKRVIIGIIAILAGLMSLSAVLLGWPPIRGYIIPPQ
jgi:uncharacterized membrane protein